MNQSNGTTGDAASMPQHDCERERCANSQQLRALAEKLENRGLACRTVTYASEEPDGERIEVIVVTNPAARERGEVRIGDDASVTWEFFGKLDNAGADRILDEATNTLRAAGVRFRQAGPAEAERPRTAGGDRS